MPTNPADGPILGTLYGSDAMRAVFDERAYFQRMLDVEAALARVQARLGIIPADAAEAITAAARVDNLRTEDLAASARNVGYPVVGLVDGLSRAAGAAGDWTHWGATTQDIMDTATVLQVRDGLAMVRSRTGRGAAGPGRAGGAVPPYGDGGADAPAAGAADQLRTEMRHLGTAVPGASPAAGPVAAPRRTRRIRRRRRYLASLGDQGIAVMEGLAANSGWACRWRPGMSAATGWPRRSVTSA